MIFGKTYKEKQLAEQEKIQKMIDGITRFAYLPTKLKSGQWVWLEHYVSKYNYRVISGEKVLAHSNVDFYSPICNNYLSEKNDV